MGLLANSRLFALPTFQLVIVGWKCGTVWRALIPHSKVAGLEPGWSVWVFSRYSSFLSQSKEMQAGVRLIGDATSTVGGNVSMNASNLSIGSSSSHMMSPIENGSLLG